MDAQNLLQALLSQLPEDAQKVMETVKRETAKVQKQTDKKIAQIREEAERQVAEVESKAESRRKTLIQEAVAQLEPMQKELFQAGELGAALATFVQIQALRGQAENVLPDPGSLTGFQQIGKTFSFRVTGTTQGPLWGTDVYTSDSQLAAAAVHAGALEAGEEGVVRVSVVDMSQLPVQGSLRNGVRSNDWGPYPVGYRVARG